MYAIATLVMGGNGYVPAAVALAKSCRVYTEERDVELVCLVTDDVTHTEQLYSIYDNVYTVDKITAGNMPSLGGHSAMKIYHWISDAPTKWNIFALEMYDKVLFLDADMIVLQDIYPLFSLSTPAAMFDHQMAREYAIHPDWTGDKDKGSGFTNWYKISTGLESKKRVNPYDPSTNMCTGTHVPTECLDNLRLHSNTQFAMHGGIALIKPSVELLVMYKSSLPDIIQSLQKRDTTRVRSPRKTPHSYVKTEKTLSSIDEITLSLFMHDLGYTWTHIGMEYNVAAFHTYSIFRDATKILHYVGCYKPWGDGTHGISEREYVAKKSEESSNTAYKSHHEVVEMWWKMYTM